MEDATTINIEWSEIENRFKSDGAGQQVGMGGVENAEKILAAVQTLRNEFSNRIFWEGTATFDLGKKVQRFGESGFGRLEKSLNDFITEGKNLHSKTPAQVKAEALRVKAEELLTEAKELEGTL